MVLVVWGDFTQSPCTWNLLHHKIQVFSFTFSSMKNGWTWRFPALRIPKAASVVRWRDNVRGNGLWRLNLPSVFPPRRGLVSRPRPNPCQSGQGAVRGDPLTTHGTAAGNLCVVNHHVLISIFPGNVEISRGSLWRRNCSLRNIEIIKHGFELWQSLMLTTHGGILECSEYRANFYIFQWILKFLKERWWWMLRLFCSVPDVSDVINR